VSNATENPDRGAAGNAADTDRIAYCKIFPPIGIARLGDSTEETGYYLAPESVDQPAHKAPGFTGFRDGMGRIKRQAARFRIYGFDSSGQVVRELTAEDADIEWHVRLANKKAAWFGFGGTTRALSAFTGTLATDDGPRNSGVGQVLPNPSGGFGNKYQSDETRKRLLEITSPEVTISGANTKNILGDTSRRFTLAGTFKDAHQVYLGELRTDERGRLLVLGGRGRSDAVDDKGNSIRQERWIQHYANNDDWYDDTSDGYVRAQVRLHGSTNATEVRGAAWVIVAPPDYAPDSVNIVTLFDVMEEVAHDTPNLLTSEMESPRSPDEVDYETDIRVIFERASQYKWLNETALRGHGSGKPGDFTAQLDGVLGEPANIEGQELRRRLFGLFREPIYLRPRLVGGDKETTVPVSRQEEQASALYMPPLSGDEGTVGHGRPGRWLTVTYLQHERLRAWANSDFKRAPVVEQAAVGGGDGTFANPFDLTRAALHHCVGGAFFPGIEMTSIARHPGLYGEAYRINDREISPGDITKYMAVPWQADFYECQQNWWPAQRPDDVVTDEVFKQVTESFEEETRGDASQLETVLFPRTRWDRGLGNIRPSGRFLTSRLIPRPDTQASTSGYIQTLAETMAGSDTTAGIFSPDLPDPSGITLTERLPSPSRTQFLAQEQLDRYSGRFCHFVVPSPEEVLQGDVESHDIMGEDWKRLCAFDSERARALLQKYMESINASLKTRVVDMLQSHPSAGHSSEELYRSLLAHLEDPLATVQGLQDSHPEEFGEQSEWFRRIRVAEMLSLGLDVLYLTHREQAGDMDMVDRWRNLGFVVQKTIYITDREGASVGLIATVETERSQYDGLSYRDYFHYFMNIEKYPDFVPYSKVLSEEILSKAVEFIERQGIQDPSHPESFVPYNKTNFDAKMEQIYEILRAGANRNSANRPWLEEITAKDLSLRIVRNAAFNQTDGSWLRNISRAGTTDELHGLLFEIWSDETGNGNPSLHHGNVYTTLLRQLGYSLPDINSRAYADDPRLSDRRMIGAVVPLAISQHSSDYFPELLGMTLFLEWEVLSLVPLIKRLDYFGIDSHFYEMHVGIDNATHGHGHAAKRAVELYLDGVLEESGPRAVQDQWRRVWNGFVAFALGGGGLFGNDNRQSDDDMTDRYPPLANERVASLIAKKKKYGNLQHGAKRLGLSRINDLFDDPSLFMYELSHSPWVAPGDPDRSQFLALLASFDGPMYKVFDDAELNTWRAWILWLGREGETPASKKFLGKAQSMVLLLQELRGQASGESAHSRYKLTVAESVESEEAFEMTVAQLFSEPDVTKLMRALRDPRNGWIALGKPHESAFVVDFLSGNRRMGRALDRRFPRIGNQTGRMIIVRWILAGCPIPGEKSPDSSQHSAPRVDRMQLRRLIVQQYGSGAVH